MSVATKEHHIASAHDEPADIHAFLRQVGAGAGRQLHEFKRFLSAWSITAPGVHLPNTDVGALAQQRSLHD